MLIASFKSESPLPVPMLGPRFTDGPVTDMASHPSTTSVPTRKVNGRSNARVTGLFASEKMDLMIPWESHLEYEFLCLAEVDRSITYIAAQPKRLHFRQEGKRRSHVPDFLILKDGKTVYVEVKPSARAAAPDFADRTRIVANLVASEGAEYIVVTEREIRRQPLLTNVRILLRGRGVCPPLQKRIELRNEVVRLGGRCAIGDLCQVSAMGRVTPEVVYSLILRGVLATNLEGDALSRATQVWVPS